MTIERFFFSYIVAVGILIGAIVVAHPQVHEFFINPYLWIIIAVGVFDGTAYLYRQNVQPGPMLSTQARWIGLILGALAMVLIPVVMGSRFF